MTESLNSPGFEKTNLHDTNITELKNIAVKKVWQRLIPNETIFLLITSTTTLLTYNYPKETFNTLCYCLLLSTSYSWFAHISLTQKFKKYTSFLKNFKLVELILKINSAFVDNQNLGRNLFEMFFSKDDWESYSDAKKFLISADKIDKICNKKEEDISYQRPYAHLTISTLGIINGFLLKLISEAPKRITVKLIEISEISILKNYIDIPITFGLLYIIDRKFNSSTNNFKDNHINEIGKNNTFTLLKHYMSGQYLLQIFMEKSNDFYENAIPAGEFIIGDELRRQIVQKHGKDQCALNDSNISTTTPDRKTIN